MYLLHLDKNHDYLISKLDEIGFKNDIDLISSKTEIEKKKTIAKKLVVVVVVVHQRPHAFGDFQPSISNAPCEVQGAQG